MESIQNIGKGKHFLMSIATIGAFAIGEYPEAVSVMLFFRIGELFEEYAEEKSRKSISDLMEIKPDYANLKRGENVEKVSPETVKVGDIIIVKPGEKIPLDGIVRIGKSTLDTKALTGESVPLEVCEGEEVLSGCINISGMITVEVTKEFGESTVAKILDLVENASSKKAHTENFITKFAKYYTPTVIGIALLICIIPNIILENSDFAMWLHRALIFLVVSCPCALVISIPLSFFGGIGGASKTGILVKGGNYLEALTKVDTIVFDKTGTLTKGVFKVQNIVPSSEYSKEEILKLAAYTEYYSNHPIANSIKEAYSEDIDISKIDNVDNKNVCVGNHKLMEKMGFPKEYKEEIGTIVNIAIDNKYAGYIVISDEIKEDAKSAIENLKKVKNIKETVMLTGDLKSVAEKIGKDINIDKVYSELLPDGKVEALEKIMEGKKGKVAFVGDGINDAPVLARADVGIAMGGLRSRFCNRSSRCCNYDR